MLTMTTSIKAFMPILVTTMSTHQQEELNVVEGSACNCSRPTCKPTFHAMVAKVLQITSWDEMHSLPWTQCKKWIPIGSMGCVQTHRRMLIIERWCSLSRIWNIIEKTRENNWKVGKTSWTINQAPGPKPKHDKTWAQWASNGLSKSMLERVWWCRHCEMEFWSWTTCCPLNYSNGGKHPTLKCVVVHFKFHYILNGFEHVYHDKIGQPPSEQRQVAMDSEFVH